MQTTMQAPVRRRPKKRQQLRWNAGQTLLGIYFATIIIPLFWLTDYFARDSHAAIATQFQYLSFATMAAMAAYYSRYLPKAFPLPPLLFFAWAALSVFWSISQIETAAASFALGVYIFALIGMLRSPDAFHSLRFAAFFIFAGLAALAAYHGIGARTFGGVRANMIGSFGLAIMIMLAAQPRPNLWLIALAACLPVFSQSRGVLVAVLVFAAFRWVVLPFAARSRSKAMPAFVALLGGAFAIVSYQLLIPLILRASQFIGVSGAQRLGEDLTGRTSYWALGWRLFEHSPIIGYGYSTRDGITLSLRDSASAHSGWINLLLDLGIVGVGLLIFWYLAALSRALWGMHGWPTQTRWTMAAALLAFIAPLTTEPNYVNLYHPSSLLLLVCLCAPFVMRTPSHSASRASGRRSRSSGPRRSHSFRSISRP